MSFRDSSVLVTGHTGFKGSWLAEWLLLLGARVTGLSLPPPTQPSLFEQLGLERRLRHIEGDVRDRGLVEGVVREGDFDVVFHLAAQPLVRASYAQPVETYATNVMGTAHVLEAVRLAGRPCAVVVVTTDKCYENREWLHGYREEDALGGHDPYSSSKAGAELVVSAYRRSFFPTGQPVALASARAGNVIGGGDWALDRIVPDCVRALRRGETIPVRNKVATRPWQHVLEPLGGYLLLAAEMLRAQRGGDDAHLQTLTSAFNFGPQLSSNQTVATLVQEILRHWPGHWEDRSDPHAPHEAGKLHLTIDKAFHVFGWLPRWDFAETVRRTILEYRALLQATPDEAISLLRAEIEAYSRDCPFLPP